jgi:hypothetical protein
MIISLSKICVTIWLDDDIDADVIIRLDDKANFKILLSSGWMITQIDVIIWLDDNINIWQITFIFPENVMHSYEFL